MTTDVRFDDVEIHLDAREVWRAGERVHVEPQVFDVLVYLVDNRDRVVSKIELLDEVWGDRFVSESALTSRIKSVRRVCGDTGRDQRVIRTVHGRGYRFVADVDGSASGFAGSSARNDSGGRADELTVLDDAVQRSAGGDRQVVFVAGEPGIGKSALVRAFVERCDDDQQVLRSQCLDVRGRGEPYFPLLDALSRFARAGGSDRVDLLERVAPSWLAQMPSLFGPETAGRLSEKILGATSARMLREGVDVFESIAATDPVVLVIEDLHWADDSTLSVIEYLARREDPLPLTIVGTTRPERGAATDLARRLASAGDAIELPLGPLAVDELHAVAADWLDGAEPAEEIVRLVHQRSGGVPLFARELLSGWIRDGRLALADGRITATSADLEDAPAPDTVLQLLDNEFDALQRSELDLITAAAVAGPDFDGATVAAALGADLDDVEDGLFDLARRLHYVEALGGVSWPDGTTSTRYSFTHDLYRRAARDRLDPGRRSRLHGRIGRAIETGHRDELEERVGELALHFVEAADAARAAEYLRRTGEQAVQRSDHALAEVHLLAALDWVARQPPGADRDAAEIAVRLALGPVLVATRGWFGDEVEEMYLRARELCERSSPDCPEWAIAQYGLATVTELRGQYERTDGLLQPLVAADDAGGLRLEANELLACSTFHQGDFERALSHASRVLERYDPTDFSVAMSRLAEHPLQACNSWASLATWYLGRSDESLQHAHAALDASEDRLYALSTARVQLAFLHQLRDEPQDCLRWSDATIEVANEQGFPFRSTQADALAGWAQACLGEIDRGRARLADAMERYRQSTARLTEPHYIGLDADVCLHAGDADLALERCDRALTSMSETTRTFFFESELLRLRALALQAVGQDEEVVRTAFDEALVVATRLGSPPLRLRAALHRARFELGVGGQVAAAEIEHLLVPFEGQADVPDTTAARRLLTELAASGRGG